MREILDRYVPTVAADYCLELWERYPFQFKLAKKRLTKLGDYRYLSNERKHIITVNNNLNLYSFTITYIHEVAHRVTFEEYGRKVQPHGKEWKSTFRQLMLPLLNAEVFPESIIRPLAHYLKNPSATTHAHAPLLRALRKYDNERSDYITLAELPIGENFQFQKRTFKKLQLKRTRVVCQDISSQRNYLISAVADVIPLQKSTLVKKE